MKRQMHINLFIQSRGHHEASWRHPGASKLPLTDIQYSVDLAQRAEKSLFDSIFLADTLGLWNDVGKTTVPGCCARSVRPASGHAAAPRLSLRVDTRTQEVQLGQVKCHPLG